MRSLKGYTPALARLLGTSPAALYERQRALVRAGMLDASEGRGPGSGVKTNAGSVALLIIAVLATDSLTETENRTRPIANATPVGNDFCPVTGAKTFFEALALVLSSEERAERCQEICVSRTAALARIIFQARGKQLTAEFAGAASIEPELRVTASLSREPISVVAADVRAWAEDDFIASATEHQL